MNRRWEFNLTPSFDPSGQLIFAKKRSHITMIAGMVLLVDINKTPYLQIALEYIK